MAYICIKGVVTSRGPVSAGETVDLPDYEGFILVSQGKFAVAGDVFETREPVIEHRDPVIENRDPVRRGRPRKG